jgi:DNA polymerase-3 subunit epsilon
MLKRKTQIVFDIETDGSRECRVCQLSYLVISRWRVRGKNMYFKLDYMNYHAQKVHGLSIYKLRRLSGGDIFAYRADEVFRDFSRAELLIGHDVQGDVRYLTQEFRRLGMALPATPTFCTLKKYTREVGIPLKQNPSKLKPPRLEELMQHFGITPDFVAKKCKKWFGGGERAHDARYDAAATYLCMLVGEEKV